MSINRPDLDYPLVCTPQLKMQKMALMPNETEEGTRERVTVRRKQMKWIQPLEVSLMSLAEKVVRGSWGYPAKLERLWHVQHPILLSSGRALSQKLAKLLGPIRSKTKSRLESRSQTSHQNPGAGSPHHTQKSPDPAGGSPSQLLGLGLLRMFKWKLLRGPKAMKGRYLRSLRCASVSANAGAHQPLIDEVGDLMLDISENCRLQGLWVLNCLFYAGAKVVVEQITDHAKEEGEEPDLLLDSEAPVVDLDPDPDLDPTLNPNLDPDPDPDYWADFTPPAQVPNPTSKVNLAGKSMRTCLAKERSALAVLHRSIGWLESEMSSIRKSGFRESKRRRCRRRLRLKQLFGGERLTLSRL